MVIANQMECGHDASGEHRISDGHRTLYCLTSSQVGLLVARDLQRLHQCSVASHQLRTHPRA